MTNTRNYWILLLSLLLSTGCQKANNTSAANNSTTNDPQPPQPVVKTTTVYYGQSYDYSDCDVTRHSYYTDTMVVTRTINDSTISFSGSRSLKGNFTFKESPSGKYTLPLTQNMGYSFTVLGDSLYGSYNRTHGMCIEYYRFGGKK